MTDRNDSKNEAEIERQRIAEVEARGKLNEPDGPKRIAWLDGKEMDASENAFGIIAQVCQWLKELGNDNATIKRFQREAMDNDNAGMLQYITDTTGITFAENEDDDDYY